jgi:glyoxylase-like metal-dependent hydrolase (beta-lactamase superfamily II)
VTTHFHDDHVAGAELLRAVHGTEVWSPANVAPILESPDRYDLPCLWFDPVPVDRVLPLGEQVQWREYELTAHALPGHTRYAAAIELEVDGRRVLATGDQQSREADGRAILNYQYRNRFAIDDYVLSAELYARLEPDLVLTGHWGAHELSGEQIQALSRDGARVAELHRALLPADDAEGVYARIVPYRPVVPAGETVTLHVEIRNPLEDTVEATVRFVVPDGWSASPDEGGLALEPGEAGRLDFDVTVGSTSGRTPIAAELTLGELQLGQHAEAVVTVT